jgi:hypothetical protein
VPGAVTKQPLDRITRSNWIDFGGDRGIRSNELDLEARGPGLAQEPTQFGVIATVVDEVDVLGSKPRDGGRKNLHHRH